MHNKIGQDEEKGERRECVVHPTEWTKGILVIYTAVSAAARWIYTISLIRLAEETEYSPTPQPPPDGGEWWRLWKMQGRGNNELGIRAQASSVG